MVSETGKFFIYIYLYLMLLMLLLLIPIAGLFLITTTMYHDNSSSNIKQIKLTGLVTSIVNLFV